MTTISRQGDWIFAQVGDELVMMSFEQSKYIGLNDVGARIWDLLDTPRSVEALCAALVEEYDVPPAACRAEVDAFLAELDAHRAVSRA